MATYVALLRGINVGGKRSLKMTDLAAAVERCGGSSVRTYIQSGNVIFDHTARSATAVQTQLEGAIADAAGFPVPVVLRSRSQLQAVLDGNPFTSADAKSLHVTFFADKVPRGAIAKIDANAFLPEEFSVSGREVYLHLPNGMGRSQLAATLARVLPNGTTRNWNTINKLVAMAS